MINKLRQKLFYGLSVHYLLDRLSSLGIGFRPFFIVEEGSLPLDGERLKTSISPFTPCFLTEDEIRQIAHNPEVGYKEEEFMIRIEKGCKCFGLKHHSELLAYMWCNFSRCESYISYKLEENEVYLFDAWTFKEYRGKNLAPILRDCLYTHLKKMGYKRFYSVSDAFNSPALKFKEKLGAKNLKLMLHMNIVKKIQTNILLKKL